MKHLYDSENVLITFPTIQEMCQREMGPGRVSVGQRKREGKRAMGTDRLSERKSRKAEREKI